MKKNKTTITTELAAGSVTSPYFYEMQIEHHLCRSACSDSVPMFTPVVSVVGTTNVGTNQYLVTLSVEGVIHYTPCNACECNVKAETINEDVTIALFSADAITSVTIAQGTAVNTLQTEPCKNCSDEFMCSIPLTLTIV